MKVLAPEMLILRGTLRGSCWPDWPCEWPGQDRSLGCGRIASENICGVRVLIEPLLIRQFRCELS